MNLQLISDQLWIKYHRNFPDGIFGAFSRLKDLENSTESFSYYTSQASVFSNKLEEDSIELEAYVQYKKYGKDVSPGLRQNTDDLYEAYKFAQSNRISARNIAEVHQLLSKNYVEEPWRGKFRIQSREVPVPFIKARYVTASPFNLEKEMFKLYADLQRLLDAPLSFEEVFYYAAYIHLIFIKIQPWEGGNGRTARLLEKWFIAEKLGEKAWLLESERMYFERQKDYYSYLAIIGLEYEKLKYEHALPFLAMLPTALKH